MMFMFILLLLVLNATGIVLLLDSSASMYGRF